MARSEQSVVVVGGGLVGSLLSLFLVRRGLEPRVFERTSDLRDRGWSAGRSINLVLTHRGLHALGQVGVAAGAMELTVPVTGRMIHAIDGQVSYQPYGRDDSERNYSISRKELNEFLIDQAESRGVRFEFGLELDQLDPDDGSLRFSGAGGLERQVDSDVIFGTDGAGSMVRARLMQRAGAVEQIEMLDHGYKELEIPIVEGRKIERGALHIWPRGSVMLMALPNRDGSFTVTLYLPYKGPLSFEQLGTPAAVSHFFETQFPDAVPLIPALEHDFFDNPTGSLGTVRCSPWHVGGRALLLGDAAHAIVPFFGQGMNCGFEDCTVLGESMEDSGIDDWEPVFARFASRRKPNADAIAEMALDNFVEMRDRVGDARFLLRKQVEHGLEQRFPLEYRSRYSMVMYSRIPYAVAREAGEIQQEILSELCSGLVRPEDLDTDRALSLIRERLTPLLDRKHVSLDY